MPNGKYTRVKLTAQQTKYWQDTLSALSWIGPGFIHVIYTLLHRSGHGDVALFTEDLPHTAATDGYQMIFNPTRFFKYDLMERCFIVLHEVFHEILNHVRLGYAYRVKGVIVLNGKELPYSHPFANIVQDFVINAILIASKLGKFNLDWLHDESIATENDTWIEVYFRHAKVPPPITGVQFDEHLDPHESEGTPPEEAPERNEAQWGIVVQQAMEIQATQAGMPEPLKHFFEEVLRPKVDWTDHVRGLIVRMAGSGAYDWQRLDRRLIVRGIGAPGMSGHGAGLIVVGGDSSGSVHGDPALVQRFLSEIGGMLEDCQPEEIRVVWCDADIRRVDVIHDAADLHKMMFDGVPGGGSTDFRPVFKYIADNDLRPDIMIYLTDGYGTFPDFQPDYPVIFGDITHEPSHYPSWGIIVDIPTTDPND